MITHGRASLIIGLLAAVGIMVAVASPGSAQDSIRPHAALWAKAFSTMDRYCPRATALNQKLKTVGLPAGGILDPVYIAQYQEFMKCASVVHGEAKAYLYLLAATDLASSRYDNTDLQVKSLSRKRQHDVAELGEAYANGNAELADMLRLYRDNNVQGY